LRPVGSLRNASVFRRYEGYGLQPVHNPTQKFLEINPRGEAALQLFDITFICHPERSVAQSKDLLLLFVAMKGTGW
jgi:hypothetical protein